MPADRQRCAFLTDTAWRRCRALAAHPLEVARHAFDARSAHRDAWRRVRHFRGRSRPSTEQGHFGALERRLQPRKGPQQPARASSQRWIHAIPSLSATPLRRLSRAQAASRRRIEHRTACDPRRCRARSGRPETARRSPKRRLRRVNRLVLSLGRILANGLAMRARGRSTRLPGVRRQRAQCASALATIATRFPALDENHAADVYFASRSMRRLIGHDPRARRTADASWPALRKGK